MWAHAICGTAVPFDLIEKPKGSLDLLLHLLRHGTSSVAEIMSGTGVNRDTYQRAKARLLSLGFVYEEQQADNLSYRYLGLTQAGEAFAQALAPAEDLLAATAMSLEAELARLEAAGEPSTVPRRLYLLELVADREVGQGRWDAASGHAARLAELARASGDARREALGRLSLGQILQRRDRHEEAIHELDEGLRLARSANAPDLASDAEYLLGASQERRGQWTQALERFFAAGNEAVRAADPVRRAFARQAYARVLARQGRAADAYAILEEVVTAYEGAGAEEELPRAYASLGSVAYMLDRPDAPAWFEKAIEAARRVADPRIEAHGMVSAAAHWIDAKDFRKADAYLRRARSIFADLGETSGVGAAALNGANLLAAQGRWGDAERAFDEALALAREAGDRYQEASVLLNRGQMEKRRDRRDEAILRLGQAKRLFTELGSEAKAARCEEELRDLTGPGTR